jgi:hypothetical protein
MRTKVISRRVLVGIGMLAAASMVACSAKPASTSAGSSNTRTATPAASAATIHAATVATSPPAAAPSATPGGIQNLVISGAEKSELAAAYAAFYTSVEDPGVSVSDIGDPAAVPGSVYYAYDPATGTYWALADFEPTTPFSDQTAYMEGSSVGFFKRTGAGAWQVSIYTEDLVCGKIQFFPPAVLTAWALPTTPPAGLTC